jgi:RNA-directed DNA polymerase
MAYSDLERRLSLPAGAIAESLSLDAELRYAQINLKPRRGFAARPKRFPQSRQVYSPIPELRSVQSQLARFIGSRFTPHRIAHAYTCKRGIRTNAEQHVGAGSMVHIDLVNFFGSIDKISVSRQLSGVLDDLSEPEIGAIVELCCLGGALPQGSPASPIISNLVCYPLDESLEAVALSSGCVVTRYSDDIYFSAKASTLPPEIATSLCRENVERVELGGAVSQLIERHGFTVNFPKLKMQTRDGRMTVTGLVVNDRVAVPSEFRTTIRAVLHRWKEHGLEVARARSGFRGSADAFVSSLRGYIDYVGQIEGKACPTYRRFIALFNELRERDQSCLAASQRLMKSVLRDANVYIRC